MEAIPDGLALFYDEVTAFDLPVGQIMCADGDRAPVRHERASSVTVVVKMHGFFIFQKHPLHRHPRGLFRSPQASICLASGDLKVFMYQHRFYVYIMTNKPNGVLYIGVTKYRATGLGASTKSE